VLKWIVAHRTTTPLKSDDTAPLLDFGVVDTHVHLMSTTNGINYTWTKPTEPSACPCRPPCACNMSLQQYAQASAATAPADYVVFCEVSAAPGDWLAEAKWVQALADADAAAPAEKKNTGPQVGAIMAQPPPGFYHLPYWSWDKQLDVLQKGVPLLRGVRAYLDEQKAPDFNLLSGSLDELGRRGLVVDTFVPQITDLRLHKIISACEGTMFNIEHFGCGCSVQSLLANKTLFSVWETALKKLAALPNIGCFQLGGTMAGFGSLGRST